MFIDGDTEYPHIAEQEPKTTLWSLGLLWKLSAPFMGYQDLMTINETQDLQTAWETGTRCTGSIYLTLSGLKRI